MCPIHIVASDLSPNYAIKSVRCGKERPQCIQTAGCRIGYLEEFCLLQPSSHVCLKLVASVNDSMGIAVWYACFSRLHLHGLKCSLRALTSVWCWAGSTSTSSTGVSGTLA